jgi:16S rRNA (uracil1498-N3)-methyltransferase
MQRFFVPPENLQKDKILLEGEQAHQISRVLRLVPGDTVLLLDGQGYESEAEILNISKTGPVEMAVRERREAQGEPALKITLYQSLLKGERFEWVLQKGTEIGITAFVPVMSARCVAEKARMERWQKIVKEAAEQSRRGHLPEIAPTIPFTEALKQNRPALLAWEEERALPLKTALSNFKEKPTEISLFIGPEGGYTAQEAEQARAAGVSIIGLGKRILRAETAGPVASALVLYHFGEME